MTYAYQCISCRKKFDVVKLVKDMDINEYCPKCGEPAERKFLPENIYIAGAKVTHAEYNPGLGCVVKNERHKKDILKEKGLVEVGNDYKTSEKMADSFDKDRAAKMKKRYDDCL